MPQGIIDQARNPLNVKNTDVLYPSVLNRVLLLIWNQCYDANVEVLRFGGGFRLSVLSKTSDDYLEINLDVLIILMLLTGVYLTICSNVLLTFNEIHLFKFEFC